jgi:uncharacterized membrane protein (DUF373 family)
VKGKTAMFDESKDKWLNQYECAVRGEERLVSILHKLILIAVRVLAIFMTLVILWAVIDVMWLIYKFVTTPPYGILQINEILGIFGAFLVVLIAIEIFVNIVLYLREDVIHVRLVIATALMAAARKVIVFDYATVDVSYVWATGLVIVALAASYWLVHSAVLIRRKSGDEHTEAGA